jgi:hypothetical protein
MKYILSILLFVSNLLVWAFFWLALFEDPKFHLPYYAAFLTFLICYFILPKLFFQTNQKVFSFTTYEYIWAQLKWANGIGIIVGILTLLFLLN